MKKYIPYIVILLITYLVVGFVKMQFNPQYWTIDNREGMIGVAFAAMMIYPFVKGLINSIKE